MNEYIEVRVWLFRIGMHAFKLLEKYSFTKFVRMNLLKYGRTHLMPFCRCHPPHLHQNWSHLMQGHFGEFVCMLGLDVVPRHTTYPVDLLGYEKSALVLTWVSLKKTLGFWEYERKMRFLHCLIQSVRS